MNEWRFYFNSAQIQIHTFSMEKYFFYGKIVLQRTLCLIFQLLCTSKVLPTLRHPESAVRGEEVVVEVHLFNSQDKEAKVSLKLSFDKHKNKRLHYNI